MRIDLYNFSDYTPRAPYWKQVLWYFIGDALIRSTWLPFSSVKAWLLRCFGSKIGKGVKIKGVRVKFPWELVVGDYVWIGENVWIDNVATVTIESNVCVSQDVYLCTGNHDWGHENFKIIPGEIYIEDSSWIAARAVIGPGVTVGRGAILSLGSVTGRSLQPMTIYSGNPAQPIKKRVIKESSDQALMLK